MLSYIFRNGQDSRFYMAFLSQLLENQKGINNCETKGWGDSVMAMQKDSNP